MGRDSAAIYGVRIRERVSIRAPAWGATSVHCGMDARTRRFNPRARVGRDFDTLGERLVASVSIRAPAWGATLLTPRLNITRSVSIRAPAWGATFDQHLP